MSETAPTPPASWPDPALPPPPVAPAAPLPGALSDGLLRASRATYRAHRRRLLATVLPVYAGLTLLGALNALLLVDEAGADGADTATTTAAVLVLAGAFWTIPAIARAIDDGRRGVTPPLREQRQSA